MNDWQPIETLPDNTVAILWQPEDEDKFQPSGIIVGSVDRSWKGGQMWVSPHLVGGWEMECDVTNPTHWMPLPEPPVAHVAGRKL